MTSPRLEDAYELFEEIGQGGFGVVFRGRARADGAPVAVKWARSEDAEVLARAEREAQLLKSLRHPNLVAFHGLFRDSMGKVALVYELVEGRPLPEVAGDGAVPLERALGWLAGMAAGLDALHAAGLLHRDLKPENVMVTAAGQVKLIDFGLARLEVAGSTVTAAGVVVGTPAFMAPELLSAQRATRASDLYSFAAMAYDLLVGRPPFDGPPDAVIEMLRRRSAPLARSLNPGLSGAVEAVLARALDRDPGARFPYAAALVLALQKAQTEAPTEQTHTRVVAPAPVPRGRATPRRASRRSSRRILRRNVGAAAGLCLLASLAFAYRLQDRRPAPAPRPTEAPAPTRAVGPLGPEYPARVRAELTDAAGLRIGDDGALLAVDSDRAGVELLSPDPARMPVILEHLPETARFHAWLRGGGDPLGLSAAVRVELREADERFRGQGLLPPFFPWVHLEPVAQAVTPGPRLVEAVEHMGPALPDLAWTGWAGAAVVHAQALVEEVEDLRGQMRRNQLDEPEVQAYLDSAWGSRHQNLGSVLNEVIGRPTLRPAVVLWTRAASERFAAVIYAVLRAIEAGGPEGEAATALGLGVLEEFGDLMVGPLVSHPPETFLGPRPRSVEAMLFHVRVLRELSQVLRRYEASDDALLRRSRQLLTECLAVGRPGDPSWARGKAFDQLFDMDQREQRWEDVAVTWRAAVREWDTLEPRQRARLARNMVKVLVEVSPLHPERGEPVEISLTTAERRDALVKLSGVVSDLSEPDQRTVPRLTNLLEDQLASRGG